MNLILEWVDVKKGIMKLGAEVEYTMAKSWRWPNDCDWASLPLGPTCRLRPTAWPSSTVPRPDLRQSLSPQRKGEGVGQIHLGSAEEGGYASPKSFHEGEKKFLGPRLMIGIRIFLTCLYLKHTQSFLCCFGLFVFLTHSLRSKERKMAF